jgi:hypothetical protein
MFEVASLVGLVLLLKISAGRQPMRPPKIEECPRKSQNARANGCVSGGQLLLAQREHSRSAGGGGDLLTKGLCAR